MSAVGPNAPFPFSAVVGHDDVKLSLILATIDPALAGVLLRGEKGSAKTTLARGLAALLPGDAPFVELPLGATEDRVLGSIDLATMLTSGETRFRPGLLAQAHGGVLYVDEINLLADHLVDALLDVTVSGVNRVEREGMSHEHPARFVLIGSMNPEEGELRPQLLDRFGMAVDVSSSHDPIERMEAVQRRLGFDRDPVSQQSFAEQDSALRQRVHLTQPAEVPTDVVALACRVAVAVEAEGLRADLMLCRAAAALAGWEGRPDTTDDDVRRVAPLVLSHRRRRLPFDQPGITPEELDDAFDQAGERPDPQPDQLGDPPEGKAPDDLAATGPNEKNAAVGREMPAPYLSSSASASTPSDGRRSTATGTGARGRFIRSAPAVSPDIDSVAVNATATVTARRRAVDPAAEPSWQDIQEATREQRAGNLILMVVDASGSMGAKERMSAAKGAVLGLLTDAYQRRDRVALIAFRGAEAEIILRPTGSIEIARARLADLPSGGATPLASGLDTALRVAQGSTGDQQLDPLIVLITDGRATGEPDAFDRAQKAAARIRSAAIPCVVIDAETDSPRLGLAGSIATTLDAPCLSLRALEQGELERVIRGHSRSR